MLKLNDLLNPPAPELYSFGDLRPLPLELPAVIQGGDSADLIGRFDPCAAELERTWRVHTLFVEPGTSEHCRLLSFRIGQDVLWTAGQGNEGLSVSHGLRWQLLQQPRILVSQSLTVRLESWNGTPVRPRVTAWLVSEDPDHPFLRATDHLR